MDMKKTVTLLFGLTDTKLTLSSTIRLALPTIATIAVITIGFKEIKSSKRIISFSGFDSRLFITDSEKPILIPGLQNLANNCFLNVVLQALASCVCFQSFLDNVIAEYETDEQLVENMPLISSLASLLQELSSVSTEKVILSPTKLMHAMSSYIPDFDLTSQQDAAEAFVHLMSSLREESGGCYAPKISSLADIFASNNRILTPIQTEWQSEPERWQRLFLGPFDGILNSSLTCQSCSSQISNKFESFDCLPLSPVLSNSYTIRVGCTLVDCLKQFIVAEHIENYHCSHCWHNAAIKYLTLMEGNKVELGKLKRCSDEEFCECRKTYNLENLPWLNRFSRALKQLSIARSPRILCIQLKRVHMNNFGESFKLQVISKSSTSVLVSSIRFGNFHSEIVPIKPIKSVKPRIEGYIIKIGEIPCFLNQLEHHDSVSSPSDQELEIKEELIKTTNSAIPLPRFETTQNQALDLVMDALKNLVSQVQNHNVDISVSNRITISSINFCDYRFENSVLALNDDVMASAQECDSSVIIDPPFQSLFRFFFRTTAVVAVETVFDPGGVIVKPLSVAKVLDDYGEIRSCESQSHNDGKTDYVIIVFDPGGNQ